MGESMNQETRERLLQRLSVLYTPDVAEACLENLCELEKRYSSSSPVNHTASLWDERDSLLITYGDMVREEGKPPLRVLKRFLDARLSGAINIVHILPFFPYTSDDGFSVADYRVVDPALGEWCDVDALHERFNLMFDLVLNHCSRSHAWFKAYEAGEEPYTRFFAEASPEDDLSAVVRPRSLPLLTPVETSRGLRHVWTTFSDDQMDLNFAEPAVLIEFIDTLLFYAQHGSRIVRLDAIAFLWKKIGTNCLHLPETHEVVKIMREMLELCFPKTILLTETNVPHRENVSYFGDGDEARMVYQFSLAPLVLHALLRGDSTTLTHWARDLEPPPTGCTYLNFTASHDGVGVRPLEGIVEPDEIAWLAGQVEARGGRVSTKRNSDGSDSPYELNITYFSALADPDSQCAEMQIARFICSQAIALSMQGIPAVYFHSLMATPNDLEGMAETGRNRSINRKKWDYEKLEARLGDPSTSYARVFETYRKLLWLRRTHAQFHPDRAQLVYDLGEGWFALKRGGETPQRKPLLAVFNMRAEAQQMCWKTLHLQDDKLPYGTWDALIGGERLDPKAESVEFAPYQVRWLVPTD